jgi:4'-phosphopantetheinyl transferase
VTEGIPLAGHEVHVWSGDSPADHAVDPSTWNVLSPHERAAAGRLRDDGDRAVRVLARATLRRLLARYTGTDPERLPFERNRHGKPELVAQPGHPRLRFNVSHSGAKILVAVTTERELGVDVERIQPEFPWGEVACSLLSSVEIATIRGLPPDRRVQTFFDCWVRKEAYLKGLGTGLSVPLGDFVVPLDPSGGAVHDDRRTSPAEPEWRVHPLDVGHGYAAALAVAGDARIVCRRLSDQLSLRALV